MLFGWKITAAAAAIALALGGFAGYKYRDGIAAREQVAALRSSITETERQIAVALKESAAGQEMVKKNAVAFAESQQKIEIRTKTIIKEVVKYVPQSADAAAPINVGFVRIFDAAASGAPDPAAVSIAPGQPNDAPSDVRLSEVAAVSVFNAGVCAANAEQLKALQKWATETEQWYIEAMKSIRANQRSS